MLTSCLGFRWSFSFSCSLLADHCGISGCAMPRLFALAWLGLYLQRFLFSPLDTICSLSRYPRSHGLLPHGSCAPWPAQFLRLFRSTIAHWHRHHVDDCHNSTSIDRFPTSEAGFPSQAVLALFYSVFRRGGGGFSRCSRFTRLLLPSTLRRLCRSNAA